MSHQTKSIQAIRGMNDILPQDTPIWQQIEQAIRMVTQAFTYQEIRFPLLEYTPLFARTIGEVTDIVEKEMYTFADRHGESLSLRPEGTAGCVRAGIQHGLLYNQIARLWYMGPMFRYERPQQGRYRQFHQLGIEAYGLAGPDIDVEIIQFAAMLWEELGLTDQLTLEINSLGTTQSRSVYREQLVAYFKQHESTLDEDSKRRLTTNPLRILDSKNPMLQALIEDAPKLPDYLDATSIEHFAGFTQLLDSVGIAYRLNPRLVRGLDYYSLTVFEWVTDKLGAQSAVCAGGRYDDLIVQLGGKPTPAVGFALGIERLVALLTMTQEKNTASQVFTDAYLIMYGEAALQVGFKWADILRRTIPGLRLQTHCGGGSIKHQLKRADKSGAKWALILGDQEVEQHTIGVKWLREDKADAHMTLSQLTACLQ